MDCKTALRMLESCRPTGNDLTQPELAPAAVHLEECSDCLGQFRARQSLDGQLAAAAQAVPVPADLRQRIHARLDSAASRRRRLRPVVWTSFAAAAALVLVAAGIYFWPQSKDAAVSIDILASGELFILDDAEIQNTRGVPESLSGADALATWCTKQLGQLKLNSTPPARWPIDGLAAIGRTNIKGWTVAVFQYIDARGPSYVLALPAPEFAVTTMRPGTMVVHRTRGYVVVGWQVPGTTYVAVLKGWSPEDLQRLLAPSGGMT